MGTVRSVSEVLVGKYEGKRPLGIHWHRSKDKIKWITGSFGECGTGFVWLWIGIGGRLLSTH
jgi:hypothetical protein